MIRIAPRTLFVLSLLRLGYGIDDVRLRFPGSSYRTIFVALYRVRSRRVAGVPVERYMAICARRIAEEEAR